MTSSLFEIDKLSDSNYDAWAMQMKSLLMHKDLWDIVSGADHRPEDDKWQKLDEKANAVIILGVTPLQIHFIKNCKTSAETWRCLQELHRPKGPATKVALLKQLCAMRMLEGDCIQQYMHNFSSVAEQLAATDIELQDELLVIMILASLPKSYEDFVMSMVTEEELPSLSTLKLELTEEGEHRKAAKAQAASEAAEQEQSALAKGGGGAGSGRGSGRGGDDNHEPGNSGISSSSSRPRTRMPDLHQCFVCGHRGHCAPQCLLMRGMPKFITKN